MVIDILHPPTDKRHSILSKKIIIFAAISYTHMCQTFTFPVQKLFPNITSDLSKYTSAGIPDSISSGLNNDIKLLDLGSKCSDVAGVDPYLIDGSLETGYSVSLSASYCQYLWIICDVAIRSIDYLNTIHIASMSGKSKDELIIANEMTLSMSDEDLTSLIASHNASGSITQFREQTKRINELLKDENFLSKMDRELSLALSLIKHDRRTLCPEDFSGLSMNDGYGLTVNSCLVKGVSFILLHELHHLKLKHLEKATKTSNDEIEADAAAFWTMYSDIGDDERFTVVIGILCMLFSLFIKDFGTPDDKEHPGEDTRVFHILEIVSGDNPKYTWLIIYLFILWSNITGIENFPEVSIYDKDAIEKIKDFLSNYHP